MNTGSFIVYHLNLSTLELKCYNINIHICNIFLYFSHRVGIEHTHGHEQNAYLAATTVKKEPIKEEAPAPLPPVAGSDSDSDSN